MSQQATDIAISVDLRCRLCGASLSQYATSRFGPMAFEHLSSDEDCPNVGKWFQIEWGPVQVKEVKDEPAN